MAASLQIRVNGGKVTITLGGSGKSRSSQATNRAAELSDVAGAGELSDPGGAGELSDPGSGTAGSNSCCCSPTVIGPIVLSGCGCSGSASDSGGAGELSDVGGAGELSDPGGAGELSDPGSGAVGANSGCCGPTVIGPIVIGGCCSNGGSSSSAAAGPQPLDPSSVLGPNPNFTVSGDVPFSMQTQMEDQWCWNAVAVSVNDFLDPADPPTWDQPSLAAKVLPYQCGDPGTNDPCDHSWSLDSALTATGNLYQACFNQYMKFADLQNYWANNPLPVCVRIVWINGRGNAHFIALTGASLFSAGLQLVTVNDPSPSNYGPAVWNYDLMRLYYQCPPDPLNPGAVRPRGYWNDTYFVQP